MGAQFLVQAWLLTCHVTFPNLVQSFRVLVSPSVEQEMVFRLFPQSPMSSSGCFWVANGWEVGVYILGAHIQFPFVCKDLKTTIKQRLSGVFIVWISLILYNYFPQNFPSYQLCQNKDWNIRKTREALPQKMRSNSHKTWNNSKHLWLMCL